MVGCCCQLDGHEFEQAPGVGHGQGEESDTTERLHFLFLFLLCFTVESHLGFSLGRFCSIPRDTDSGPIPGPRARTLASIPDVLSEALL